MIEVGGEKGAGRSALAVQHDDDDDIYLYMKVNMDQNPTVFSPVISTNIHCYVNYSDKENHDRKEDYITIAEESRLEKS